MIRQNDNRIFLETEGFSYVISLEYPTPVGLYWGRKIDARDGAYLCPAHDRSSFESEMWRGYQEFPAFDGRTFCRTALKADCPLFLETQSVRIEGEELTLSLADRDTGFTVELHYRVYPEADAIERSARVRCGRKAVKIRRFFTASAALPFGEKPLTAHYFSGCWSGEFRRQRQKLGHALIRVENRKGLSGPDSSPFIMLTENEGEDLGAAYGFMLGWSGSWAIEAKDELLGGGRLLGGWNDDDLYAALSPGEEMTAPPVFLCASPDGAGGLTRAIHSLERKVLAAPRHERKVLYNSWYATEFDVRSSQQMALAKRAASIGIELFVVDDGWFCDRSSDRSGLGDWKVEPVKFPNGLEELIDCVHSLGMAFGLWIEPESVNPGSAVFEAHPDWIFSLPGRDPLRQRNQYLLNLGIREAEAYAHDTLSGLMKKYRIDYFKWDMNRTIADCCEALSPLAREKHILAVYRIVEALRNEYPDLDIEACSGGGGRADIGMISRTDQFWVSDNTVPFDRLRIQEGASLCYAPVYTSCWVTDLPGNARKSGRDEMKYKFHSAMLGTLGIGADLTRYSDDELREAARLIGEYKQVRHLVFGGDLYRLALPSADNLCAEMFVSPDKSEFVLFSFLHSQEYGDTCPNIRLKGLDGDRLYECGATGKRMYGSTLMNLGVRPHLKGDFDSEMQYWVSVRG